MTTEQMRIAGSVYEKFTKTDDELQIAIQGTKLAIAFLLGKGEKWNLAPCPLYQELSELKSFVRSRQEDSRYKMSDDLAEIRDCGDK